MTSTSLIYILQPLFNSYRIPTTMRLDPADRKIQILNAAIKVASKPGGWIALTRHSVAENAGCTEALVSHYFGTMIAFRRTVMRAAVSNKNLAIIAQGLACGDKCAQKADSKLRSLATHSLNH